MPPGVRPGSTGVPSHPSPGMIQPACRSTTSGSSSVDIGGNARASRVTAIASAPSRRSTLHERHVAVIVVVGIISYRRSNVKAGITPHATAVHPSVDSRIAAHTLVAVASAGTRREREMHIVRGDVAVYTAQAA